MTTTELAVLVVASIGVLVMLLSAIGLLRLPDVYTRMHAASQATSLGVTSLMIAAGIYYPNYLARMIVLVGLFLITGPIATTTMARAAYRVANPARKFVLNYDEMGADVGPVTSRSEADE